MKNSTVIIVIAICVAAVVALGFLSATPKATKIITVATEEIVVLVASDPIQHSKGLSGFELDMLGADGMLFKFSKRAERTFWMKGMNFDLDIVWIAGDKIVKIERNIPAPHGAEPRKMKSIPYSVDHVLELPAGGADLYGLVVGMVIENL